MENQAVDKATQFEATVEKIATVLEPIATVSVVVTEPPTTPRLEDLAEETSKALRELMEVVRKNIEGTEEELMTRRADMISVIKDEVVAKVMRNFDVPTSAKQLFPEETESDSDDNDGSKVQTKRVSFAESERLVFDDCVCSYLFDAQHFRRYSVA